jgi:hypothetical protein
MAAQPEAKVNYLLLFHHYEPKCSEAEIEALDHACLDAHRETGGNGTTPIDVPIAEGQDSPVSL